MFKILPPVPFCSMCQPASCERRNTAVKFTAISSSQNSVGYSEAGALRITPALFTRVSMEPNSATVFSIRPGYTFESAKSPEKWKVLRPAARISAHEGPGFGSRPWQPTFAPAFARATAIAAPSPRCDPVTRAFLPFNWKAWRLIDSLLPASRGNEDRLLAAYFQSGPALLKPR